MGIKKTIVLTVALILTFGRVAGADSIQSLVGDKDCFGSGIEPCDALRVVDIQNDPGDESMDLWGPDLLTWTHEFAVPSAGIREASLTMLTFDIEDGGAGDGQGGGPFDDRLTIDNFEVAGAFDTVFTPDGDGNTFLPTNRVVIVLDPNFFPLFSDGSIDIAINPNGGAQKDFIAIDFSELTITPVPIPSSLVLIGPGILIVLFWRRSNRLNNVRQA